MASGRGQGDPAMDRRETNLLVSASSRIVIPIVGMVGGLILGGVRTSLGRMDELAGLSLVIRWTVTGFFLGLALVLLLAISVRRNDLVSIRRLMVLVAMAGL